MAVYTGYYIRENVIHGPLGAPRFHMSDDGYIHNSTDCGPGELFYISKNYIYGPRRSGEFYIDKGNIYGPDADVPWLSRP